MPVQFKFFMIPARCPDQAETELNRFLQTTRTLTIHREFVNNGENAFWSLAVEYLSGNLAGTISEGASRKSRIDYKAVLSPEDFAVFVQLREWRKKTAEKEGVPVYTIFTNEQLAAIVTGKITTLAALGKLEGIGDARLKKYGNEVIQLIKDAVTGPKEEDSGGTSQ